MGDMSKQPIRLGSVVDDVVRRLKEQERARRKEAKRTKVSKPRPIPGGVFDESEVPF